MPMPHGSKLHIPPTNYRLLTAQQEPYTKAYVQTNAGRIFWGKDRQKNGPFTEKRQDRKSKRQKKERADRKWESNGSPELPDRRDTSNTPGLTLGGWGWGESVEGKQDKEYKNNNGHM